MAEKTYSGLCVGGPLSGQNRTHWHSEMTVNVMPSMEELRSAKSSDNKVELQANTFKYLHFQPTISVGDQEEVTFYFWAPATGVRNPHRYVIEELVRAYAENEKAPDR